MKKKNLILIILILISASCFAQQDAQYTQYMYNTLSVNPAYAGTKDLLSVVGLHRSQWVGLDGAPSTQTLSINSPISEQIGVGFSVVNDKIGPSSETYIDLDFSYSIKVNKQVDLAFGLKAGLNILDVNFDKLQGGDDQDYTFQNNIDNRVMPNVGVGLYLYSDHYYLGLSAPDLLETDHYNELDSSGESFLAKEKIHAYLMGGYVWDLNHELKFKPAFLLKGVSGSPLQVDISSNFMYQEKFILGAAYRWDAAVSLLAGFQVTDRIMLGYSYDFDTTELRTYNSGSHEIILRFEFLSRYNVDLSPRFF